MTHMYHSDKFRDKVDTIFTRVFGVENIERASGVLRVFVENEDDRAIANTLASVFYLETPRDEIAHENFLRFVEIGEDDWEDEEDVSEDEDTEEEDTSEDDEEAPVINGIDEDGRSLKVLTTAESHKFASKVFHQMLGNDDLSRYPAFMMDLDRFLAVYKNKSPKQAEIDVASSDSIYVEVATLLELAKKPKSERSVFLSALMGVMSSDAGMQASTSFAKGDVDGFSEAMGKVVMTLLENMPEAESSE